MIGGGHFAGAIVSHMKKNTRGNAPSSKESLQEQAVDVVVSKHSIDIQLEENKVDHKVPVIMLEVKQIQLGQVLEDIMNKL